MTDYMLVHANCNITSMFLTRFKMCFPVVSEKIMAQHRLALRIETREEIESGIAKQYPVKKADIVSFKEQEHDKEPSKKLPECKIITDAHHARRAC